MYKLSDGCENAVYEWQKLVFDAVINYKPVKRTAVIFSENLAALTMACARQFSIHWSQFDT